MSVSVSMPQLGESVTEGTVTRWLKKEGERVEVDEPLLEVSTDKVDTEIPSPASGILRGIAVDEDETVAVGAQLAVIEDSETSGSAPEAAGDSSPAAEQEAPAAAPSEPSPAASSDGSQPNYAPPAESAGSAPQAQPAPQAPSGQTPGYAPPPAYGQQTSYGQPPVYGQPPAYGQSAPQAEAPQAEAPQASQAQAPQAQAPQAQAPQAQDPAPSQPSAPSGQNGSAASPGSPAEATSAEDSPPAAGETPYVTPLVRKLAAEHAVNLDEVSGTGVGGRIRKQDVIEAARTQQAAQAQQAQSPQPDQQPQAPQEVQPAPAEQAGPRAAAPARPAVVPSSLRGTTQRMTRPRQVIAQRMVESLHVSAQLTTVVEADVTAIARLRERAKSEFEGREGVKLTFLPFFALAAVEALKVHPKLNAVIDGNEITYHDAEHVGIAVDTERGLMVPVIHSAGDLNLGGLARKIGDLAQRTRSGQVGPDELAGGTFTLTNTGSRGALFDTPIINQPQVAILGTGTVVKRPVVVEDPALGEVIAVRSMVYLALTYDHRLVDGADAARFLTTVKNRLEEGAFEAELGL
jgi:pyruvate dehydrogenase E2 component (dihydrolipoamide acetyltransferase)